MTKRALSFIWLILLLTGFANYLGCARAAAGDFSIIYPNQPGPLFQDQIVAPAQKVTKTIQVTNNGPTSHPFVFVLSNFLGSQDNLLNKNLALEISRGSNSFYRGQLSDTAGAKIIETIPPTQKYDYDVSVSLANVDNSFQGLKTGFDAVLGFWQTAGGGGGNDNNDNDGQGGGQTLLAQDSAGQNIAGSDMADLNNGPQENGLKEIAGAENSTADNNFFAWFKTNLWWLILVLAIILFWLFLVWRRGKRKD